MDLVSFNYADISPIALKKKKELKRFIISVFEDEGRCLEEINYIFCSDEYLLKINNSFLHHDYYTDIITFDLSDDNCTIGEVYISVDRVRENSNSHLATFREELLRVIFHGALHLVGFNDKKKSEITVMRQKEDYYLRLFEKK